MIIRSEKLRRFLKVIIPFVLIPLIVLGGSAVFQEKMYAWLSFSVVVLALLLFCTGFEKRTVGTRRMVTVAVMTALSVAGRIVFAVIPGFKPVTAIVVITAIYLGGECGFLVGVLTALISNFTFGQGPWTPFQMFAWGMIGLLAGLLAEPLKTSRVLLSLYGIFAGIAYSFLMDVWTVLWYNNIFDIKLYLAAILSAVPYTVAYAVSNVIFLLLLGRPFGEKLQRVRYKYGI